MLDLLGKGKRGKGTTMDLLQIGATILVNAFGFGCLNHTNFDPKCMEFQRRGVRKLNLLGNKWGQAVDRRKISERSISRENRHPGHTEKQMRGKAASVKSSGPERSRLRDK